MNPSDISDESIEEAIDGFDLNLTEKFLCPISLKLMKKPVIASDGKTYEQNHILQWQARDSTSPLTREPLTQGFQPNLEAELQKTILRASVAIYFSTSNSDVIKNTLEKVKELPGNINQQVKISPYLPALIQRR